MDIPSRWAVDRPPYIRLRAKDFCPNLWQGAVMSVLKMNAIAAPDGGGEEFEKRFAVRAERVDQQPGFEEFMLLRPVAGDTRYFVLTPWAKPNHPAAGAASLLELEVVSRTTPRAAS